MTDFAARIDELFEEIHLLDSPVLRVPLAQEAVSLADQANDPGRGFAARQELINAATFGGRPDLSITAFAWCLAQSDADPQTFDPWTLFWQYKWIVGVCDEFPTIGRARLEQLFTDMRRRYEAAGLSLRPCLQQQSEAWSNLGELAIAEELYHQMQQHPRDWMADCHACEINMSAKILVRLNRLEDAFAVADPVLSGRLSCAEVPQATIAALIIPAVRLKRVEQAAEFHRAGYRKLIHNVNMVEEQSQHLKYLTVVGNWQRAMLLFERHLPMALASPAPWQKFEFFTASRLFLHQVQKSGRDQLRVKLPREFPAWQKEDRYAVADLREWFDEEVGKLSAAFDQRNGNSHVSHRAEAILGLADELADCREE